MDNYEIIGTTRKAIEFDFEKKKIRNPEEQDKFVESKYNRALELVELGKRINTSPEKIAEIEEKERLIRSAYNEIKTPFLRMIYNRKIENAKAKTLGKETVYNELKKMDAYEILNTSRASCDLRKEEKNDIILKKNKEDLERYYSSMRTPQSSFSDREKIDLQLKKISESYELIKTAERRKIYNEELDKLEQERIETERQRAIKEKYSHISEVDSKMLKNVLKKKTEGIEIILLREDKEIILRKTGEINFLNSIGNYSAYINEYEISRNINGEKKVDTIYTNLSLPELSINKKSGKPVNEKYYNCVVNKLLAEDTIEGSKYNGGYIGMIEKNQKDDYDITLVDKKLNPIERENMTAVMIVKEIEEREKKGEDR